MTDTPRRNAPAPRLDPSDVERLSRTVSYALRHRPREFGLEPDVEGWVPLDALVAGLHARAPDLPAVEPDEFAALISGQAEPRHEVSGDLVRARYGHSFPVVLGLEPSVPPPRLFHGTSPRAVEAIRRGGLLPMRRQYVHLSATPEKARRTGARRSKDPVVLTVDAGRAAAAGVSFHRASEDIWLTEHVPPRFLD